MMFDELRVSTDKTPEENIRIIKSWAEGLVDNLQMLNNQVEDLTKKINDKK